MIQLSRPDDISVGFGLPFENNKSFLCQISYLILHFMMHKGCWVWLEVN
jgi:hypothetical protein